MVDGDLSKVFESYAGERGDLIPILQQAQELLGYIQPDAVRAISRRLRISEKAGNMFIFWFESSGYYTFFKQRRQR